MESNNLKLDEYFAALSLIEILFEQGLINKSTMKAVREHVQKQNSHNSQAA